MSDKDNKPVRGFILLGTDGSRFFRRYKKDGSFVDFKIVHSDLEVEIIGEHDFYFYQGGPDGTRRELDHSRETLGLPPWPTPPGYKVAQTSMSGQEMRVLASLEESEEEP